MSQPGPISKKRKVIVPPFPLLWGSYVLDDESSIWHLLFETSFTQTPMNATMDNCLRVFPSISPCVEEHALTHSSSLPTESSSPNSMNSLPANSLNKVTLAAKSVSLLPEPKSSSALPTHRKSLETRDVVSGSSPPSSKSDSNSVTV